MTNHISNEVLAHYGVLGMKWGVRKDGKPQGYQGGGSTPHELYSKERQIRANTQLEIARITGIGRRIAVSKIIQSTMETTTLSQSQKAIATTVGSQITNGIIDHLDSGSPQAIIERIKGTTWKTDPKLKNVKTISEIQDKIVKQINPDYGDVGTVNNCRRATMAYEMRRRGYDVKARKTQWASGQTDGGMAAAINKNARVGSGNITQRLTFGFEYGKKLNPFLNDKKTPLLDFKKSVKENSLHTSTIGDRLGASFSDTKAKAYTKKATQAIFDGLAKQPNGSRGELGVTWFTGGGHSVAYEIIKGKPYIIDTQTGRTYSNPSQLLSDGYVVSKAYFTRLDNLELNENYIKRWVTNA